MNQNLNSNVSGANSSSIVIRMPLLSVHPYNNRNLFMKHQTKFKEIIPKSEISNYNHDCMVMDVPLAFILEENVSIQVYKLVRDSAFIRRLQRFILQGVFTNSTSYAEKYMILIATKELYLKSKKNYLSWFPVFYKTFLEDHRHTPPFQFLFGQLYMCATKDPFIRPSKWTIPTDFECTCYMVWSSHQQIKYDFSDDEYEQKEEVEVTSIVESLTNFSKSIAATVATNYYAYRAVNCDITQVTNDLTADLLLLITNFNLKTLIWAFVKLINRLFNVPNLFSIILNMYNYCRSLFTSSPGQQNLGEFEPTMTNPTTTVPPSVSETYFDNFFSGISSTVPAVCSIMATILVVVVGIFMGKDVFNENSLLNRSKARRVCEAFHQVSKGATGIRNLYNILIVWPKWVYEMSFEYILGQDQSRLEELLYSAEVRDPEGFSRREFFDDLNYLTNPINTATISRNKELRTKLLWCDNLLNDMAKTIAQTPLTQVDRSTSQWIYTKLHHTRLAISAICKLPSGCTTRFTPFWVNIIGDSGLGKTTLIPRILSSVKEVIKRSEVHKNEVVPEEDSWSYSMNFCAKHMTGYNGQYCVIIDDLFQDASIVGDATPSALLLIQMVSSQPFPTIQASLEDKGIEFTSKIIMSSSNAHEINRKEIVDSTALLRRMNVRVHVRAKPVGDKSVDKGLVLAGHHRQLYFDIYDCKGKDLLYTMDYDSLCAHIAGEYLKWYELQHKIMKQTTSYPKNVDTIVKALRSGAEGQYHSDSEPAGVPSTSKKPYRFPTIPMLPEEEKVESTRSIYCTIWGTGKIKIEQKHVMNLDDEVELIGMEQYDCDCDNCIAINRNFRQHRHQFYCTQSDITSINEYKSYMAVVPDEITTHHQSRFKRIWQKIKDLLSAAARHPLITILGALATLGSIYYLSTSSRLETPVPTRLMYSSGSVPKKLQPRVKVKPLQPIRFQPTSTYNDINDELRIALPNQNTYDLVFNKILKKEAMCILKKDLGDNKTVCNSALRIVGTCILSNHHFFDYLKEGDEFEVIIHNKYNGLSCKKQIFNLRRYIQLEGIDAGVYKCDNKLPHSTSLVNHFMDKTIPDRKHHSIMLSIYDPKEFSSPVVVPGIVAEPYKTSVLYDNNFTTLDTFATNMSVTQGQSGSILISTEPSAQNKIIGILVCRSKYTSKGYFKPIPRSSLEEAIRMLDVDQNLAVNLETDIEITSTVAIQSYNNNIDCKSLNYLGRIPLLKQVSQPVKTSFIPSLISDGKSEFSPAVLHPEDDRLDPDVKGKPIIYRSVLGYNDEIGAIDTYELDVVVDEMSLEYRNMETPPTFNKCLLNDYQMINGIKPYLKKLDMRTSPGYPFVKEREAIDQGKYRWFNEIEPLNESDGKVFQMKEELKEIVSRREERARNGFKSPTIAYMCLKDELRPNAKIKRGETRVFTCLPMDYNLLIRKYFGAFIMILHHNAGKVSSCVGVNPAKDWYEIWMRLNQKNVLWEDFDYKNWDQHLHPELVMKVADLVSNWYGDSFDSENAKVRRVLLHDLVHTTVMVKDSLFAKSCGQCSGCSITAELNCVVHDILMYYVYRLFCKDRNILCDLSKYRSEVACAMYGDDIIKSVIEGSEFIGMNIKPYMDKLGMSITPGDKTSTEFTLKNPSSLLFLKRGFTIDKEISQNIEYSSVRAPLKKDIVLNIYQWVRKSEDPIVSTRDNCETALREFFMYGRKEFCEQKCLINNYIEEYNNSNLIKIDYVTLNYDNLLREYDSGNFNLAGLESDS